MNHQERPSSPSQRQWHGQMRVYGHRREQLPQARLRQALDVARVDPRLLVAVVRDTLQDSQRFAFPRALAEPEVSTAIETVNLLFAAQLLPGSAPPRWLFETFIGYLVRRLVSELWTLAPSSDALRVSELSGQGWDSLDLLVGAIDRREWPSQEMWWELLETLEALEIPSTEPESVRRWLRIALFLVRSLGSLEGVAGLYLIYMCTVTIRTWRMAVANRNGLHGAHYHFLVDVLAPQQRLLKRRKQSFGTGPRGWLFNARRATLEERLICAREGWGWTPEVEAQLRELSARAGLDTATV